MNMFEALYAKQKQAADDNLYFTPAVSSSAENLTWRGHVFNYGP